MLIAYKRPVKVNSPDIRWSTLEEVFEYMEANDLMVVEFSHTQTYSNEFGVFTEELFEELMKMAHATHWYDSGNFETITKTHNNKSYHIKIFESHADCASAYDTLYSINIEAL